MKIQKVSKQFHSLFVNLMRKDLPLVFVVSYRILSDFQERISITLVSIKIGILNKNSLVLHENLQIIPGFH